MKNLKFLKLVFPVVMLGFLVSCSDDDDNTSNPVPIAPTTYTFEREVDDAMVSTVSYGGQTTRLMQADELYDALNSKNPDGSPRTFTEQELDLMFGGDSNGSGGFADPALNSTSKIIRSKTSAYANTATNLAVFDGWLAEFANDVAPNLGETAADGVAGMFDGYQLNAAGQELDQLFFKSLIGAFALDQIINNYITPSQLDSGTRRDENTAGTLEAGDPYTTMEHKWDEGFGYLYGQVADVESNFGLPAEGEATGNLLMKYFNKVNDPSQGGAIAQDPQIAETVYNAFIAGRHAITVGDYDARDAAAAVIKTELSKVIGMYAKYYLNDYLLKAGSGNISGAHHSLSEGYGFIFSLQFTNDGGDMPYMSNEDVMHALIGTGGGGPADGGYFADFHNMQDIYITAPGQGMIALIDTAFGF
jgi:hypothetical protein